MTPSKGQIVTVEGVTGEVVQIKSAGFWIMTTKNDAHRFPMPEYFPFTAMGAA